jgi:hypothetical protein
MTAMGSQKSSLLTVVGVARATIDGVVSFVTRFSREVFPVLLPTYGGNQVTLVEYKCRK